MVDTSKDRTLYILSEHQDIGLSAIYGDAWPVLAFAAVILILILGEIIVRSFSNIPIGTALGVSAAGGAGAAAGYGATKSSDGTRSTKDAAIIGLVIGFVFLLLHLIASHRLLLYPALLLIGYALHLEYSEGALAKERLRHATTSPDSIELKDDQIFFATRPLVNVSRQDESITLAFRVRNTSHVDLFAIDTQCRLFLKNDNEAGLHLSTLHFPYVIPAGFGGYVETTLDSDALRYSIADYAPQAQCQIWNAYGQVQSLHGEGGSDGVQVADIDPSEYSMKVVNKTTNSFSEMEIRCIALSSPSSLRGRGPSHRDYAGWLIIRDFRRPYAGVDDHLVPPDDTVTLYYDRNTTEVLFSDRVSRRPSINPSHTRCDVTQIK